MRIRMATWVTNLQDHIVTTLEGLEAAAPPDGEHDAQTFLRDHWIRPTGGEGSSCVLAGGRVFEKAGVNVSVVEGKLSKGAQMQMRNDHDSIPVSDEPLPYFATGVSIVIHPRSPHVPTVHMNYRYFELCDKSGKTVAWWFGGGTDLTPNYLYPEDAVHFHDTLKEACDKHDKAYYPEYKAWCDKYFYLPHRGETRGVGGIFFDDLTNTSAIHKEHNLSQEDVFSFVKSASSAFLPAYVPIVKKRLPIKYTEEERKWQLLRRGRYVEFNLLYDRGTKFGLNIPGARVESILMSLPEVARWEYMNKTGAPGSGTREEKLLDALKKPREWASK
jgi:coproporphyrinogen III oxidase